MIVWRCSHSLINARLDSLERELRYLRNDIHGRPEDYSAGWPIEAEPGLWHYVYALRKKFKLELRKIPAQPVTWVEKVPDKK